MEEESNEGFDKDHDVNASEIAADMKSPNSYVESFEQKTTNGIHLSAFDVNSADDVRKTMRCVMTGEDMLSSNNNEASENRREKAGPSVAKSSENPVSLTDRTPKESNSRSLKKKSIRVPKTTPMKSKKDIINNIYVGKLSNLVCFRRGVNL
ncbi:unnamed protein product [Parnassius apollo]|uniref:(apollo) hypothetical protein n=1 Tax=Parnassius apollo TaxID=110799 RepID=A0A8S3X2S3_PARAO|nr:unnamed protein product [Parnassius apollo]